ncbi:hypothetical protein LAJLEIBI_02942 [[Clostridium] hylemonae DSM 15053]|uniref:hypothetical protein n=1 Tax=[Clostridium] hylemonae TaxID=89153 RepID=UPI001257A45D|nr:hypothetical protein LAJLEIBI_02942 [[Clostridium] hylemonae DSM 15053]
MAIGGLLGLIIALGIIVLIFVLDDTIKTPDDVEHYLGLNVLTSIPIQEGVKSLKGKGHVRQEICEEYEAVRRMMEMQEIYLKNMTKDYRSNEAYKTLRTNVEFSG